VPQQGLVLTRAVQEILKALVGQPAREHHGVDICVETGMSSGTIYPVLAKLEALEWVDSGWEEPPVHDRRGGRRRYYRLNPYGLAMARGALAASARGSPGRIAYRLRPAGETA
jgi:PadR family transcriptional regulator PadR